MPNAPITPVIESTSSATYPYVLDKEWYDTTIIEGRPDQGSTYCLNIDIPLFLRPPKSSVRALLGCAVGWVGDDLDTLLAEVRRLRSEIKF